MSYKINKDNRDKGKKRDNKDRNIGQKEIKTNGRKRQNGQKQAQGQKSDYKDRNGVLKGKGKKDKEYKDK